MRVARVIRTTHLLFIADSLISMTRPWPSKEQSTSTPMERTRVADALVRNRRSIAFLSAGAVAILLECSTRLAMASGGGSLEGAWNDPPKQPSTALLIGILAILGATGVLLLLRRRAK